MLLFIHTIQKKYHALFTLSLPSLSLKVGERDSEEEKCVIFFGT